MLLDIKLHLVLRHGAHKFQIALESEATAYIK